MTDIVFQITHFFNYHSIWLLIGAVVIAIAVWGGMEYFLFRHKRLYRIINLILLAAAVYLVLRSTLLFRKTADYSLSPVPFDLLIRSFDSQIVLISLLLNVILFMPLAMFGCSGFCCTTKKQALLFFALGVSFSILIELLQLLLSVGEFDIDDVICNTLGLATGYWLYRLHYRYILKQKKGVKEVYMNILVTGAKGMVGQALCANLKNLRDGKNRTRPALKIDEIFEYDIDSTEAQLEEYCRKADFVFHLAGVNRPKDNAEFMQGNFGFAEKLLETLKKYDNKAPVMLSSSIQATLIGRYGESDYGKSKLAGEELFFRYGEENGVKTAVYRFPNLMGHSRPNYNSAVSTFCNAVANDLPFTVNDRSSQVELLYIDDLIEAMFDLLEGKEKRCEYDGLSPVETVNGRYCYVPLTYKVTLGEIVDLLEQFKAQHSTLVVPPLPNGSFAKKLYSLYLSYLPTSDFKFPLKMNCDDRGSFTELLKTADHGQFSVNISKPGVTKGQHWHNSKWEFFIVVSGKARIEERNIHTNETVSFEVSGEQIEAVHMIPGWTHNIINLSDTENLVTLMWANEQFDPNHPDTFFEPV